jgi:hypothetical protein
VTLGQGNHHIEPSLSKTTTTTYSELDNHKRHRDEASEASSSRRFFGGEVSSETERDRTRRPQTAIPSILIDQLVREYGLSEKQRKVVSEYRDSRGEEFVREKAEIVRAQPRQNAARALMAALRDDWQPPVATKGQSNATHKASVRAGNRNIGNSNEHCDLSQYKSRK